MGYRLDDRGIGVRFLEKRREFFILHRFHSGSRVHTACYLVCIRIQRKGRHFYLMLNFRMCGFVPPRPITHSLCAA